MFDLVFFLVAATYFLYPIAYAFLRKMKRPVLLGVSAHGVNVSVLLLCAIIYLPVHVWLAFLAPYLSDFGYLSNMGVFVEVMRAISEYGIVVFLLVAVVVTPYVLCKREAILE